MNADAKELNMSMWFSTYGILTAERILAQYNICLKHDELIKSIKTPQSFYYQLLRVPLKNVMNGIILDQAHEYQVYAQKLFIDFLLSGQNDQEENAPGTDTRDDVEAQRTHLIELGESFNNTELAHKKIIAESQASALKFAANLQQFLQSATKKTAQILKEKNIINTEEQISFAIREALTQDIEPKNIASNFWDIMAEVLNHQLSNDLRQQIANELIELTDYRIQMLTLTEPFLERANDMSIRLRQYRSEFYQIVLRTTELLGLLTDYRPDPAKQADNRESLNFDSNIGEH